MHACEKMTAAECKCDRKGARRHEVLKSHVEAVHGESQWAVNCDRARKSLRLAILGARGDGAVHARIVHQLGGEVAAILGSSEQTAAATAAQFQRDYGFFSAAV
ncbi:MAG: hypothetical protein R2864_03810 [Syntrophotaleaceae bacterium]